MRHKVVRSSAVHVQLVVEDYATPFVPFACIVPDDGHITATVGDNDINQWPVVVDDVIVPGEDMC
jgi:hypothetical protein